MTASNCMDVQGLYLDWISTFLLRPITTSGILQHPSSLCSSYKTRYFHFTLQPRPSDSHLSQVGTFNDTSTDLWLTLESLGELVPRECLSSSLRDPNLIGLGWGAGVSILKKLSRRFFCAARLRTTGIKNNSDFRIENKAQKFITIQDLTSVHKIWKCLPSLDI